MKQTLKPILFNGDMVKAILDGRKSVTRRVMKPQPHIFCEGLENECKHHTGFFDTGKNEGAMPFLLSAPCNIGDIVYVNRLCLYIPHKTYWRDGIQDCEVIAIKATKTRRVILLKPIHTDCWVGRASNKWFPISAIGNTVFLTKEDAKNKIKNSILY